MLRQKQLAITITAICAMLAASSCSKEDPTQKTYLSTESAYAVTLSQAHVGPSAKKRGKVVFINKDGTARALNTGEMPYVALESTPNNAIVADGKNIYWLQPDRTQVTTREKTAYHPSDLISERPGSALVYLNPGIREQDGGPYSPTLIDSATTSSSKVRELPYMPVFPRITKCHGHYFTTMMAAPMSNKRSPDLVEIDISTGMHTKYIPGHSEFFVEQIQLACGNDPDTLLGIASTASDETHAQLQTWDLAAKTTKLHPINGSEEIAQFRRKLTQTTDGNIWVLISGHIFTAAKPEGPWRTAFTLPEPTRSGAAWFDENQIQVIYWDNSQLRMLTYDLATGQQTKNMPIVTDKRIPDDFATFSGITLKTPNRSVQKCNLRWISRPD